MTAFTYAQARQPRGAVKLNGELITGWVRFDVENNNYSSADTFSCTFAAQTLPADRNLAWFAQQRDMYVELFIGFPADPVYYSAADLQSWIYGQVDDICIDWLENTVEVSGRDLTRVFIDAKTTQKWPNQTASQIATSLATAAGLTPVVKATKTLAGKFYEIDHVNMADERSEWDILQYLASREQFQVWVRGQSLYFQPPPDPTKTEPYPIVWQPATDTGYPMANFEHLKSRRALTVSRGVQVLIRSWNKKQKHGFTATYPNKAKTIQAGKAKPFGGTQVYERTIPNLTQQEALIRAQALYQQITAHEMKLEDLVMPGDNALDTTSIIQLTGTGTAYDQLYYPDSIHRELSLDGGYTMTVNAKNHSPQSEIGAL